jgi:hypothetical protein
MHAFWLTLLLPLAWLLAGRISGHAFWSRGGVLALVATVGWTIAGMFVADAAHSADLLRCAMHHLVSSTDLPLVQLTIAFAIGWMRSQRVGREAVQ